jgi:SAM-dependent methyltransferase
MKAGEIFEFSSQYYDLLYSEKNYKTETVFIEKIFEEFGKPKSILEIGSGTGNYTQILLRKGYRITGVDISEKMVEVAKKKCPCTFVVSDVSRVNLDEKFDACIALFAVMGYVTENSKIKEAFANIRKHLKPNGLLVFDVWNGLAVLRTLPELRVKEFENDSTKIVRIAIPNLKAFDHICEVKYKLLIMDKTTQTFGEFEEDHIVRFFFPQELKMMLEISGFKVLKICPFLEINGKVDQTNWNTTVIARAT